MLADSSPSVHEHYRLKPSRYALGFQLCCFVLMVIALYCTLHNDRVILFIFIASMCWFLFLKQDQIEILTQLDHDEWSVQWRHSGRRQRVELGMIFDHQFYIVLYFKSKGVRPLLIWPDQLALKSWKSLKTRAKLI